jgi:glucosamine-phosphate N-acetyltransferase
MVAHVEEVCVSASQQGKGLGLIIINALNATAKELGVGKLILDCSEKNVEFYEKCGYSRWSLSLTNRSVRPSKLGQFIDKSLRVNWRE